MYASDAFKMNNVENMAVEVIPRAIQYASTRLKNNYEIVKLSVEMNPYSLMWASDTLKDNF